MKNAPTDYQWDKCTPYIQAGAPQTPEGALIELANHPDSRVRRRVAENSATAVGTLLCLAADPNPDVRLAVAENPALPIERLSEFVQDESVDLRYALAENHSMPAALLYALTADENAYVASRAFKTLMFGRLSDCPARLPIRSCTTYKAPSKQVSLR